MFELTPRRHELVSVLLLSIGTIFMFLGYDVQAVIAESVIHSINKNHPERISSFAGYNGQAVQYISFAFFSLFTATLQHYLSSKTMLILSSVLFSTCYLSYLHINSYFYYSAQFLVGLAYACYNNAEGMYLSEHSSRRTIDSNSALETGIGHSSLLFGGITMLCVFSFIPHTFDGHFFSFDETIVKVIYFSLMALTCISILIFAFLPTKQFDSIALDGPRVVPSLKSQFKRFSKALSHLNALLLVFTYVYMGCMVSFMYGIYPTTLSFTSATSVDVYIIPIYLLSSGVAAFSSGLIIRPLIKRLYKYKLLVPMTIHTISMVTAMILVYLSVPNTATIQRTTNVNVILKPSRIISITIGLLLGLSDFTITMARSVICQIAIPEYRTEVFSLTRIYQCVASCVVLLLSSNLTVLQWIIILLVGLVAGTTAMIVVLSRTQNETSTAPIEPLKEEKTDLA